ncbi:MAG: hypothetical protein CVU97_03415 [Firmicutes bacterium HGW-Firmicutes-21]|nr:MAG: hypothetical protein CVU97_03415 [Firmicutes bacterium HGW-Firmicutes-21]
MNTAKKTKRALTLLLTVVMLVGITIPAAVFPVRAEEVTVIANGFNTARGTGQLIIFNSEYGASTGTNEWGYEVVVSSDNVVTKIGGNNNAIPSGGFVLSGHDADDGEKMKTYLMENVKVGDYIVYNISSLIITISDKPIAGSSYYTITKQLDAINGMRNTDFLVVYTAKGSRTGTNEWGYEVICEGGRIVSLGGNDSLIPSSADSFVISGHGTMTGWLKLNVKLGMTASFDAETKILSLGYDEEAAAFGIRKSLETIEADYERALERFSYIDFSAIKSKFDLATNTINTAYDDFINGGDAVEYESACRATEILIEEIKLLFAESRTVEYRGVWIRPTQTTEKAVDDYVQELYDSGINHIFIETLYGGTMIMPMPKDSLFVQNPSWRGFDMLQAYIDACHKRDMELHIWMTVLYVGHPDSALSLGTKKPEWLAVHNKGGNYTEAEDSSTYQFINPANEEAVDYLLDTYKYIFENYNIDGFQLDYIRYFRRNAIYDYGYDDISVNAFKDKYGVTPKYDPSASYWDNWVAFRAQYVTDIVIKVRELIDEVRPSILLSASVAADIEEAYNNVYQDYMNWLKEGYIDILNPMSYGDGYSGHIARQAVECGDQTFLAVGRSTQMPEFLAWDILRLAREANDAGADGSVYFEASSFLKKGTGSVLTNSIYRNRAITPTLNKGAALIASLEYAIGRIDDIILPLEGMTAAEADSIRNTINDIINAFEAENEVIGLFGSAAEAINTLTNENAKAAIAADLAYARKIAVVGSRVPDRIDVIKQPSNESDTSTASSDAPSPEPEKNNMLLPVIVILAIVFVATGAVLFIRKKNS